MPINGMINNLMANPSLFGGDRGYFPEYSNAPVSAPVSAPVNVLGEHPIFSESDGSVPQQVDPMAQMLGTFMKLQNQYPDMFGGGNTQKINDLLAERQTIGQPDFKKQLIMSLIAAGVLGLGSIATRGHGYDPGKSMEGIQGAYQKGFENKTAMDLSEWDKQWAGIIEGVKSGDLLKKTIMGNIISEGMKEQYAAKYPKMITVDPTHDVYLGGKKLSSGIPKEDKLSNNVTVDKDGKRVWAFESGKPSLSSAESVPKEFADKWGEQLRQEKNGKYKWHVYNKLTNEVGEAIRDATEKDLKTGNKTTVSFASHSKWDSTIDKEFKELTSRYKLTGSEVLNVDPNNPQALLALFMNKGLTADSARDFKAEYDRIKEIQALGRDDIEEGISPYKRLGKKSQPAVKNNKAVSGSVMNSIIGSQNNDKRYGGLWR